MTVTAAAGTPHKRHVDTPESVVVVAEYAEDFVGVFTINYAAMKYKRRYDQLTQLDGDRARMDIGREEFKVYAQGAEEKPVATRTAPGGFDGAVDLHVRNFLDCVRTRKTPTAPVALAFQAVLVIQMANLSIKQGRRLRWNAQLNRVEA